MHNISSITVTAAEIAEATAELSAAIDTHCQQCGRDIGAEIFLGAVCGYCCRLNQARANGLSRNAAHRFARRRR
jgi:hypothetical protein